MAGDFYRTMIITITHLIIFVSYLNYWLRINPDNNWESNKKKEKREKKGKKKGRSETPWLIEDQ